FHRKVRRPSSREFEGVRAAARESGAALRAKAFPSSRSEKKLPLAHPKVSSVPNRLLRANKPRLVGARARIHFHAMPRAAPRRGDVWGGGTNGGRLLGHELDEGADDAVELVMHGGVLSDVTRDHRDLQTSERLARGAERTGAPTDSARGQRSPGNACIE